MELRSKPRSVFEDAGPAEIVRLSQKDDHYLVNLRSQVTALVQSVKGARWWILNHRELEVATDFLYYALTTLLGNQTLGEEYVNVIQINSNKKNVPSTLRRLLLVTLHTGGAYWMEWIQRNLMMTRTSELSRNSGSPRLWNFVEHVVPRLAQTIAILHRCHLLFFYFRVRYYHFAKRLVGVRYVLIRPWLEDGLSRWGYWILGLLSLIQLLLSTAIYAYSYWSRQSASQYEMRQRYSSSRQSESESMLTASGRPKMRSCPLCLEKLESPTATPCGHVFCWQCILQSLEIKQQCPLCNGSFGPSRLIHLRNYDT